MFISSEDASRTRCGNRRGIVEYGQQDFTTIEGRIRFYNQNLTKLRPWCTAGMPTCDMP
jgi:hypothetical protein